MMDSRDTAILSISTKGGENMGSMVVPVTTSMFLILGFHALVDIAAIALGLLIFFKGRAYVRKKYGRK